MLNTRVAEAATIWNCLNGIVNVYKPTGISVNRIRQSLLGSLCRDLNQRKVRPMRKKLQIESGNNSNYLVKITKDLSDHVLAVGSRYEPADFKFNVAKHMSTESSGVLLIGLNNGAGKINKIRANQSLRVYHITGKLGIATETHFKNSLIIARATYGHVWPDRLNGLLSSMQASHQKKMFDMCGVNIQSQTAYELACKGLIRPAENTLPLIYGMRCIQFKRPEFTIEIHTLNENENYIGELIHEIGLQLHSVAHCIGIRCVRYGHFHASDSMLRSQWTLEEIITNMDRCQRILKKYPAMLNRIDVNVEVL